MNYEPLKEGDTFRIRNAAYKEQEYFVVTATCEKGIVAVDLREMKQDTKPDGWRQLCLRHQQIDFYADRGEFERLPLTVGKDGQIQETETKQ